jgi:WD40 repeat protein
MEALQPIRCSVCGRAPEVAGSSFNCPDCGAWQAEPADTGSATPLSSAPKPKDGQSDTAGSRSQGPAPPVSGRADEEFYYAAFISYRQVEPDRTWANWLHTALETYRVPARLVKQHGMAPRIGPVFRDTEELPATSDLNEAIEQALRKSQHLIVVCSPRTPESRWVNREIERFREMGRHDRILALLIEGEPSSAFPRALLPNRQGVANGPGASRPEIEEIEPLAAAVRPMPGESTRRLKQFAKLRILACLLGVSFDDLRQREQERYVRRLTFLGCVLSLLLLVLGALTTIAVFERDEAISQRGIAERSRDEANTQRGIAEKERRTAELRLAESLVLQGDAWSIADRWDQARDRYTEALALSRKLGVSPLLAEIGLWRTHRASPQLRTFIGHSAVVRSVAISPDGLVALSGGWDWTLRLWDVSRGTEIRSFIAPIFRDVADFYRDNVLAVAFSPDGRWIASGHGGHNTSLTLWRVGGGDRPIRVIPSRQDVTSVAFSPDSRTVLAGSGTLLELWDVADGAKLRSFSGHEGAVRGVAFASDGRTALSGGDDSTLRLWDVSSGRMIRTFQGHKSVVHCVALSSDGRLALSGSHDNTARIWDVTCGRELRSLEGHSDQIVGVAFSPDCLRAISASGDRTLKLWEVATGRVLGTFRGHGDAVLGVTFTPDGRMALSASWDRTLKLWDLTVGRELRAWGKHNDGVNGVAFSPDGRTALTLGVDRAVLRDVATERDLWALPVSCHHAVFTRDGGTILTAGAGVQLWDVSTGRLVHHFDEPDVAYRVGLSPDGKTAFAWGLPGIKVWDLASRGERLTLTEDGFPTGVAISSDGRTAFVATAQGKLGEGLTTGLSHWDLRTRRRSKTFVLRDQAVSARQGFDALLAMLGGSLPFSAVAFSADGRRVLWVNTDNSMTLWDVEDGREVTTFAGHQEAVTCVALSPDGRTALSGSGDETLKVWDVTNRREVVTLIGQDDQISCVAFSPDGRQILSGGKDGTCKLWDFPWAGEHQELMRRAMAVRASQGSPSDPTALAALGECYASEGLWDSAVQSLEKARAAGAVVSALTLGRCHWMRDDYDAAVREFQEALRRGEAPGNYLRSCIAAIGREKHSAAQVPTRSE